jgi:hypothetical protein
MNSASLCSLAGRYDNPIPTRFLAPHRLFKNSSSDLQSLFGLPMSRDVHSCTHLLRPPQPHPYPPALGLVHEGLFVERLYCKRPILCLASSKVLTPPPHRPASLYPCLWYGGRTHSLGGEGVGGSIFWKTPDTALDSTYVSNLWRYCLLVSKDRRHLFVTLCCTHLMT